MRQDQLDKARLARWRQDGNALLTLDDAERWLAETPLCLYLPRRQHLPVPGPSFVEAIAGRADATPGPEHVAAAAQMLARLVASGAVIALNLFGAAPGIGITSFVGEHPDFLATPEALPYLYALQPERNPKRPPTTVGGARVSPLAAEAYTLLEREGALTTIELRSRLGREVTEAAVLRSLAELWHTMRVVPVPADNPQEGAHWELLSARHRRELNIGSTQSQTTALSILVSFYLQSAIAATAEEVEIFLSPLASRSRIRDVVHGLSTTRQLASFSLAGDEQFYVEGTLPEIAEEETVVLAADAIAGEDAGLEQNEPDLTEAAAANPPGFSRARPTAPRRSPRPAFGERARGSFAARDRSAPSTGRRPPSTDRPPRREGGFRRPERSGTRGPARGDSRGSYRRPAGAEGTDRPPRPNFERRARPSFANASESRERPARSGGPSRPRTFDRPNRFARPDRPERGGAPRGSFEKGRPPRPAGGSFRRDKPFGDRPPRAAGNTGRYRPGAAAGSPRFSQDRPGRPPRDAGRPTRSFPAAKDEVPPGQTVPSASPRGILVQIAVQIVPPADRAALKAGHLPEQVVRLPQQAVRVPEQAVVQVRRQVVQVQQQAVRAVSAVPRAAMVSHGHPSAVVNHALRETAPTSGRMLRQQAVRRKEAPVALTRSPAAATAPSATSPPAPGPRLVQAKVASANHAPSALPVSVPAVPADLANLPVVPAASVSRVMANRVAIASLLETGQQPVANAQQPAATVRSDRAHLAPHSVLARANLAASGSLALPPAQRRIAPPKRRVPESHGVPGASAMRAPADLVVRPQKAASNQAASSPVESVPVGNHPEASARQSANRVVRGTKARCPLHDRRSS